MSRTDIASFPREGSSTLKRKTESYSPETRVKLGNCAASHVAAAARKYFKEELGDLNKPTMKKYRTLYTSKLYKRVKCMNQSINNFLASKI